MKFEKRKVLEIRKYSNGKLYVPERRTYLSKQGVFELYLKRDVKITYVPTGEDVTNTEIPKYSNGMVVDVHNIRELFRGVIK